MKIFLYDQKRYSNFAVLIFYICANIIMWSRSLSYFNALTNYAHFLQTDSQFWDRPYLYNFFYTVALFMKVIMGFFQVKGMTELMIRMQQD